MRRTFKERLARSLRGCRLKPSLSLAMFKEEYCLCLLGYLIPLPFLDRRLYEPRNGIMERWGIYYFERALWFCWGEKTKAIHMPWQWEHLKCEVRKPDGSWTKYIACYESGDDGRETITAPYKYVLKSGEVQNRIAEVYIERREWRWKRFMWCPWPAIKRQSISVSFDDEVGERTGSWKGGTVGCGYGMKRGETALQTLRRMEREREFN